MSRPASGDEAVLAMARETIAADRTVEQLRQAQLVVLPLNCGLSLKQTAQILGVSPGWPRWAHAPEHDCGARARVSGTPS